jgi:hypothetical protein
MKEMNRIILLAFLFLMATGYLVPGDFGNLNAGIDYNGYYTDNIFMNASALKDYVSHFHGEFSYSRKNANLYLDAAAEIYADNPAFNSYTVAPGLEWFLRLKGRNSLFLDFSYSVLNYKDVYIDFNYHGPLLQAGLKLHPSTQTSVKALYSFESRNYSNYDSFDFSSHTISLEYNRFFKSQTTLRFQLGFNYRYYPHIIDNYDFGDDYNYYERYRHQGKGQGQGGAHGPSGPGQPQPYTYSTINIPNIHGQVGVSQGIGARISITTEAEVRRNFRGLDNAETLIKNAYILYPLNDDLLRDGTRFNVGFKMVPWKEISVEGSVSYYDKRYRGVYIMDADGNVVEPAEERKDTLFLYTLRISKTIKAFDLIAAVSYRDNKSNDDYFLYKMVTISAGVGYYFQ